MRQYVILTQPFNLSLMRGKFENQCLPKNSIDPTSLSQSLGKLLPDKGLGNSKSIISLIAAELFHVLKEEFSFLFNILMAWVDSGGKLFKHGVSHIDYFIISVSFENSQHLKAN